MQQYLITTDEVSKLARTMSVHIDTEKIETLIPQHILLEINLKY